ncbi:3-deoxy-manno-octulosonate cytidylyltransferase [Rhizobium sp. BK251]|uniref:3-deoxy-manno-octulosonate cytidylyltransferase n=1 Tax=Rhizobium sp. BK251 TaxID=2512125 RepID=UPI0010531FD4|nr:3-deoxy-manno-octulosonate cytidylyltransferase [Rhizobium sp. BK251]TCL62378.1 hypothetical protein EV286_12117 [Rhizobium sp. BK251]
MASHEYAVEETGGRSTLTTAGLKTAEDWRRLLSPYPYIVLAANSDAVDMKALQAEFPPNSLFVFFNKVYKILDRPFEGNALLVARSGTMGANIVYRREVGDVVAYFPNEGFLGIMNLRVDAGERLSDPSEFGGGVPVGYLDQADFFAEFYPPGRMPTSGFALALWLSDLKIPGRIVLAGFTARRSAKWKVFDVHDWTFEQTFLRLFARLGRISMHSGTEVNAYVRLAQRFSDIPPAEIALTAAEVLAERLDNANAEIDRLISATKMIRSVDSFFRRLKPKTRKQKFLEKQQQKEG